MSVELNKGLKTRPRALYFVRGLPLVPAGMNRMNRNRVSTLLVLALLVFAQSSALFLGSANSQAGTINTFSNGSASIDISLTADNLDTNYSLEVPRNVTFQSGQFMINAKDEVASPGQVSLDIGLDGINEWAFDGLGFGDLG